MGELEAVEGTGKMMSFDKANFLIGLEGVQERVRGLILMIYYIKIMTKKNMCCCSQDQ